MTNTTFATDFNEVEWLMVRLVGENSRHQVTADEVNSHDLSAGGQLFATCQANEVLAHVGHAIRGQGIELPAPWQAAHEASQRRIAELMRELDAAAELLHSEGIPLVALKNAGIARGLHDCLACCPMGDLDVLVERKHFRAAHEILLKAGYQFEFRSPLEEAELDEAEASGGAEYWKPLSDGERLWFELQWRPVAGRWLRPDQEPSAEELMARSVTIGSPNGSPSNAGTAVRLLSPADNLLQVAVHTAKHSYLRAPGFRLHTDVDRIVSTQSLDWPRFVQSVQSRQLQTAVYFSLRIPSELFQTPVPAEVLSQLRPSRWKEAYLVRSIQRAGLLDPAQPKFARTAYIGFNAMLYDDLGGLLRGIFPEQAWIRSRYGVKGHCGVASAYIRRIFDLAFRRTGI